MQKHDHSRCAHSHLCAWNRQAASNIRQKRRRHAPVGLVLLAILTGMFALAGDTLASPIPSFVEVGGNHAAPGQPIIFDGTTSHESDPGLAITQLNWNFGDGVGSGYQTTHAFSHFGIFNVRLTVQNNIGETNFIERPMYIDQGNRSPVAVAGGPYTIAQGDTLVLNGSASNDPDVAYGDQLVQFSWDLNLDFIFETPGVAPTIPYSTLSTLIGTSPGTYPILLRVVDSFGLNTVAAGFLNVTAVPEPAALMLVGMAALLLRRGARKRFIAKSFPRNFVVCVSSLALPGIVSAEAITTEASSARRQNALFKQNDYFTGSNAQGTWRSGYYFDLTSVSGTVIGATLELQAYDYSSSAPSETIEFFDSFWNPATSTADAPSFGDLGSGTSYGAFAIAAGSAPTDLLSFPLNAAAIVDINSSLGSIFRIGGALTSLNGTAVSGVEGVFLNSSESGVQRLVLTTSVPEPAAVAMVGLAVLPPLRRRTRRSIAHAE